MTQYVLHDAGEDFSIFRFSNLGTIDINSAPRVKAEIRGYMDETPSNVIINLEGVHFVDSTGFGALISVLKTVKGAGKKLVLCNVSYEVKELMDLMQLLTVFDVRENLEEARKSLSN